MSLAFHLHGLRIIMDQILFCMLKSTFEISDLFKYDKEWYLENSKRISNKILRYLAQYVTKVWKR